MTRFMLLLRNSQEQVPDYSPEQIQQIIERYNAWTERLRNEGRLLSGEELKQTGQVVRRKGDQAVVDGPFAETKEAIGGYFLIQATDMDDAVEVAKHCPILLTNGIVEIREINEYD